MPRRADKWTIYKRESGKFDLSRGRTNFYSGLTSLEDAVRRLRSHRRSNEPVYLQPVEGDRTNITDVLKKKGLL